QKFPGPRGMEKQRAYYVLPAISVGLGIPVSQTFPLQLDRIFGALNQLRPSIRFYYSNGAQQEQGLLAQEADILLAWPGRVDHANSTGAHYAAVPGTYLSNGGTQWVIPANSAHPLNGSRLADYCNSAEPLAKYVTVSAAAPSSRGALKFMQGPALQFAQD